MSEKCEKLDQCGFFREFHGNTEVAQRGWVRMFCDSKEQSEICKRKIFSKKNGHPPADNLSPTGFML